MTALAVWITASIIAVPIALAMLRCGARADDLANKDRE